MPAGVWRLAGSFVLFTLLACASAPKPPPPAPPPKPAAPPPLPEPPEAAQRAQPPGEAWLKKPAPYQLELGVDDPATVARKLGIALDLDACRKHGAHWSKPEAGRLKRNYSCAIEHPEIAEIGFVDLGDDLIVLDALAIAFDAAEWEPRIAAFEAEHGAPDVTFTDHATTRTWSWGRFEIHMERALGKPEARLRYVDRHAAYRYLAQAIKTKKVPRVVPRPKTIPPVEPFGLVFASDDEAAARTKLEAAGFKVEDCRTLAEHARAGRVLDCPLTGAPLPGLRGARIQLVDLGDGRLRVALLEHELDPSRFSRAYGELEKQYGPVEHETLGAENIATWWIEPVQISMLGHARLLHVSYRHGRLAQIGANLIARSNQSHKRSGS